MTIGIDGMVSGLDTGAIIDGLVAIQRNQQVLLKQKSSAASNLVTALQGLNSRVSSLRTTAEKISDPASWTVTTASSSSDSVSVFAAPTAKPGSVQFEVTRLASAQVSLLDPARLQGTFTLSVGGKEHEITPVGSHADDLAAAVNELAGKTGISATRIRVGTDADGNAEYRLQLTGATGEGNGFTVRANDGTSFGPDHAISIAGDAAVTLWPSSEVSTVLTSSTNTFEDVLEGVTFTASAVSADLITVSTTTDGEARRNLVEDLVSNVAVVLSEIASRSRTATSTGSSGNTVVTGGPFSGDSAIRFLTSDIQSAMTSPVDGVSPALLGISMDRYGTISLDKAAFDKALSDRPDETMAAMQAIAARLGEVAERASDPVEGTLSLKVASQESLVKDLGSQIARWDERLETRRAQLVAQFSAMEVRLSQLQSTQSWLTNQIAGLNASAK